MSDDRIISRLPTGTKALIIKNFKPGETLSAFNQQAVALLLKSRGENVESLVLKPDRLKT